MNLARLSSIEAPANDRDQFQNMPSKNATRTTWIKSSLSTYNGTCVEIAQLSKNRVGIRDTKDHGRGPILVFSQREWSAFLAGAKAGEFNFDLIGRI
jgi:Domain of unknown function (DUF397)